MKFPIGLAVLIVLSASGAVVDKEMQASMRAEIAQSWNNSDAAYMATGAFNTNLFVTLPSPDEVDCDALVSSTVNDRVLSAQLSQLGFKTIQCMDRTARLK